MKQFTNLTKAILISVVAVTAIWLIFATAYTYTVSEDLATLKRDNRSDIVYLRNRIRDLEATLKSDMSVDATVSNENDDEADCLETVQQSPDYTANETEAVTVPTHQTPETQTPADGDLESLPTTATYLFTEYQGLIGVFNDTGELVRTINVFIMTLPESEKEALYVGIPAYSYEEMCKIAEQFE